MWKLAAIGSVLLIVGAMKFAAYLSRVPTLEDYLAFRCGPSEAARLSGLIGHSPMNWAHCWGCYAMALGAGILVLAVFRMIARTDASARRPY